jgi:hypothetical protein
MQRESYAYHIPRCQCGVEARSLDLHFKLVLVLDGYAKEAYQSVIVGCGLAGVAAGSVQRDTHRLQSFAQTLASDW